VYKIKLPDANMTKSSSSSENYLSLIICGSNYAHSRTFHTSASFLLISGKPLSVHYKC